MEGSVALVLVLGMMAVIVWAPTVDMRPTVFLYSGTDSGFAEMLASVLEAAEGIGSDVRVVTKPDLLALATALPHTECVVIYCSNAAEIGDLAEPLSAFFENGGGLVGLGAVCYEPSAGQLARRVFPVRANVSAQQYGTGMRARNYTEAQDTEISLGLPDRFQLVSMGIYLSGDEAGNYVEVPGAYSVVYRDEATGAPIVLTSESDAGGRSVALPGVWVVSNSRVDAYYGNLVRDENFIRLFTNSVRWAAKGSVHFSEASRDFEAKIEEANNKQARLREEAQKARERRTVSRVLLLSGLWAAGLLVCAVVIKKVVLVQIEAGF